jgi:hypothetical protein
MTTWTTLTMDVRIKIRDAVTLANGLVITTSPHPRMPLHIHMTAKGDLKGAGISIVEDVDDYPERQPNAKRSTWCRKNPRFLVLKCSWSCPGSAQVVPRQKCLGILARAYLSGHYPALYW